MKADADSLAIRTQFCAMRHSGATQASTMAGFGVVLDDEKLLTMPPPGNPKPGGSQISILRSWMICLGGGSSAAPTSTPAGDTSAEDAGAE